MPIDPSIPLSVRAPQIDIMGDYARFLGLQQQRDASAALAEQRRALADQRRLQIDAAEREQQEAERLRTLFSGEKAPTPAQIYGVVGPERGAQIVEALSAVQDKDLKRFKDSRELFGTVIAGLKALPESLRAETYDTVVQEFAGRGWLDASQVQPYSPGVLEQYERELMTPEQRHKIDNPEPYTLTPGAQRFDGQNQVIAEVLTKPADPAKVGSFEDYVVRFAQERGTTADKLTSAQIEEARKRYQQADDRPRVNVNVPGAGLTPTMEANVINRMVTQWTKASEQTRELDRQVGLMRTGLDAARRGDMAQGAQAVLVTFQKILDPTSVVRESEYMRSAAGLDLLTRIEGSLERLAKGGAGVPLSDLEKFAKLAEEAAAVQKKALPAIKERIGRQADRFKIPRDLVFEDAVADGADGADGGAGAPKVGDVKTFPNGKRGRWDGKGWEQIQ